MYTCLSAYQHDFDTLFNTVSWLINQSKGSVTLLSDFNMSGINWDIWTSSVSKEVAFLDYCSQFGLHQLVKEPTREFHTLDLVLVNNMNLIDINSIYLLSTSSTCDHRPIGFEIRRCPPEPKQVKSIHHNFILADYNSINLRVTQFDWVAFSND